MRKFGREQVIQIGESSHDLKRHAKGTQRLIVREDFWSTYMIKEIGSWEGYVLKTASFMHRHGDLPEIWKTTLKDRVDLGFIQRMPNEILLKIVSFISIDNTRMAESSKAKRAINTFIAFEKAHRKTKKSTFFNNERTTREFLKQMLHFRRSLGNAPLDNGLNLNIRTIKKSFDLYLKDPDNDFLLIFKLNEKIKELSKEIFDLANLMFTPANIEMNVVSFQANPEKMPRRFRESKKFFKFWIGGDTGGITIETPLQWITIYNSARDKLDPAVWAIAEALIARSGATLTHVPTSPHYYELPKSDCDQPIRKFEREQIIQITENFCDLKGTQRLIAPKNNFWTVYVIKDTGSWEGYVLETALSRHTHGNWPEIWDDIESGECVTEE